MQDVLDLQKFFLNVDNYYSLGISLGLNDITLKEIERDHPQDTRRRKIEVFQEWKNNKPNASIEDLLKALEAMHETAIAENIKRQYCEEPHTHTTCTGILSENLYTLIAQFMLTFFLQ